MISRWRIYKSGLFALVACAAGAFAHADERILSFDDNVTVSADGSMYVRETIRVRAEGDKIRRGIYRDFPTTYPGSNGQQYVVAFAFQGASRDGSPEPWRQENRGNGVRIYIGNPAATVSTGEHIYELVFRTDRQLGYFAEHDELYWNATGNGWDFPIDRATARIELPSGIPADQVRLEAYTGPQDSKGRDYTVSLENGVPVFTTTRGLAPREGLTIVAMWPKGFIMPPVEGVLPMASAPSVSETYEDGRADWSPAERMFNKDLPPTRLPALLGVMGLALLLTYYYLAWSRVGRDPPGRITIPEYELPKNQSPATMRYLVRMGYDNQCFAAAVLSLAVKGHLHIRQESGLLGLGKTFTLEKTGSADARPPSADEKRLYDSIFASRDKLVLEDSNYRRVQSAINVHQKLIERAYSSGFFRINGGWHMLGITLSVLLAVPPLLLPGRTEHWPEWHFTTPGGWFTLATILAMFVANGILGKLLKAPTIAGQAIMDHIRGFRMYLEVAEGEELKRMKGPPPPLTPQLYESFLPSALALGVEQRWAERFARAFDLEATNYSPAWYSGSTWDVRNMGGFSRDLGSSLGSAISSSSTAPGSHSGSSSGGGGGGSSGGGGGGGGGGGW